MTHLHHFVFIGDKETRMLCYCVRRNVSRSENHVCECSNLVAQTLYEILSVYFVLCRICEAALLVVGHYCSECCQKLFLPHVWLLEKTSLTYLVVSYDILDIVVLNIEILCPVNLYRRDLD